MNIKKVIKIAKRVPHALKYALREMSFSDWVKFILTAISVIVIAWLLLSWIDTLSNNTDIHPTYWRYNIFELFSKLVKRLS